MRILIITALVVGLGITTAGAEPLKIVAFGDSLAAGYGLAPTEGFTVTLEKALQADGLSVQIVNAGVAGDTAAQGLARLEWSVPEDTDAVILELGANDALRGLDPAATETALDAILTRLKARQIPVLLAGMLAPPNMGPDYEARFNAIFPRLAQKHGVLFYPFFLSGVAGDATLNQPDGMHPNPKGVEVIVRAILPVVKQLAQTK
jgi:acyl-CoA thioesterase-1